MWIIDPPSGWKYGFPKECPDLISEGFDLKEWLTQQGYPESDVDYASQHYRYWKWSLTDQCT